MYHVLVLFLLITHGLDAMNASIQDNKIEKHAQLQTGISDQLCEYILTMSKINPQQSITLSNTFASLDEFFNSKNIKDYADAAKHGRENNLFDNPDEFNQKMGQLFISNAQDIFPKQPKKYQAIIFNTSGIDVFMERLAFLSRLIKINGFETEEMIALIGSHAHRKDLMEPQYLINLPNLFPTDFDLTTYNQSETYKTVEQLLGGKEWIHRDGMEAAWQLISCDILMANLKNKFRYFSGENSSLRTEQLLQNLISNGLKKPINQSNPIAFICNSQGSAQIIALIKKYFPDNSDAVDILIAKPTDPEIEEILFHDTPQQRAMTKLFHVYRILETMVKSHKTPTENR